MAVSPKRAQVSLNKRRDYCKEYARVNKERVKANSAIWRAKPESKAKLREYHYLRAYGLTSAQVKALLVQQGGVCAICGTADPGSHTNSKHELGRWHVDHNHATGVVRGILCGGCNTGLGKFKDSADIALRAAIYLEEANGSL